MITLYGSDRSRALRNLWALKELGLEYERDARDHVSGEIKTDDYLAINPSGKVPSMTDGEVSMYESLAINLYLAMTYGKGGLWPDDAKSQADCLQWTLFAATEVEPHTVGVLMERIFKPEHLRDEAAAQKHLDQLPRALDVLEGVLSEQSYLCGKSFTIADLNVASVGRVIAHGGLRFFAVSEDIRLDWRLHRAPRQSGSDGGCRQRLERL